MAKRLTREQKKDQALIDLINKMFEIAGHQVTYDDVKDRKDNLFQEWNMTMAKGDEWRSWGEKYLKKQLRLTAKSAELEMQWASLAWGHKYSDFNL